MVSGLLYHSSWNRPSGTVWLDLPDFSPRSNLYRQPRLDLYGFRKLIRTGANLMLLVGAAGILLTMLPVAAIEIKYNLSNLANSPNSANLSPAPSPEVSLGDLLGPINETQAFSVTIPKISASSVVIPNVDPADPKIYLDALKKGIAHALGTGLPGVKSDINRTIYLFAHSTSAPSLVAQYNAQFYLLNKMEIGDEINLTFWAKNYKYRVTEIKITDPSDVSFLTPQTAKEILVLATCTPPGTTWKRLLVIAERF